MISNQATASILASLAIETAKAMGVEARLLFMTVTFATSLSLITLWGHQTNTLIYGPAPLPVHRFHQGRAAESALLGSGYAFYTNFFAFLTGIHTQLVRYIASKNCVGQQVNTFSISSESVTSPIFLNQEKA